MRGGCERKFRWRPNILISYPSHHLEAGPWIRPFSWLKRAPKSSDKFLNSSRVQGEKSHFGDIGVLFRGYLSLAGYFQDQECNYSFEIIFVKRLKSQSTPRCWDKRSDDTVHVSPTGTQATVKLSQPMSGAERGHELQIFEKHFGTSHWGIVGQFHG